MDEKLFTLLGLVKVVLASASHERPNVIFLTRSRRRRLIESNHWHRETKWLSEGLSRARMPWVSETPVSTGLSVQIVEETNT